MTDVQLTPKVLQDLFIVNGYNLGKWGADGTWGGLTEAAVKDWFKTGHDLLNPKTKPESKEFDNKAFFDVVRAAVRGLTVSQVEGFNHVLDEWKVRGWTNTQQFAYVLATAWWESGRTMQPVREGFYISPTFAGAEAWRKRNLRYYPFYGRGLVQLTWDFNYRKASQLYGVDFIKNPDLALDPVYSVKIIFDGMENGWFTSKSLDDYIDDMDEPDSEDLREFVNARRIVNGTDKAADIGKLSLVFEKAIKAGNGE